MINTALITSQHELNPFTQKLWDAAESGPVCVRLRDRTLIEVVRQVADEFEYDSFRTEDHRYYWNLDGSSITSKDYDIIECTSF